jgi:hypothetical protein
LEVIERFGHGLIGSIEIPESVQGISVFHGGRLSHLVFAPGTMIKEIHVGKLWRSVKAYSSQAFVVSDEGYPRKSQAN